MKLHAPLVAALAVSLAACGGSAARPGSAPAPVHSQAGARARQDTSTRAATAAAAATAQAPQQGIAKRDSGAVTPTDVATSAVRIFGDSVVAPQARDTAADTLAAGPSWDIDVRSYETQARVEKYIALFTGPARETFTSWLQRGTRYDAMIRQKFRAGGLPEDMVYLALVESGYNPHAYSHSAAVGMWQFMASTARGTGLRVDWWVDERRDPVRSTDAALKFIGWLREQFGSLYLACAAYNGGPGRVSRGLSRYSEDLEGTSGEDVFFALAEKDYLREETKNYVPQLIAAALIAKSPEKYGVRIERLPAYAYDSVMVPAKTPLAIVARASGSRTGEIVELNPHLLRGVTPPGAPIYVRVPVGRAASFDSALAEIPDSERVAFRKLVSKKGETLNGFAARSGRSARVLHWYNPKLEVTRKGKLAAGQTILVPTAEVASAAQDVPDPSIERYGAPKSARIRMHVVKRGENLGAIARRYKTTPEHIKALNGMRGSIIYPGQQLVVKGEVARARSSRSASARRSGGGAAPRYGAHDDAKRSTARGSKSAAGRKTSSKKSSSKKAPGKRVAHHAAK